MSDTPFIITIDTEGDDLWSRPRAITARNAAWLPRFLEETHETDKKSI